MSLPEGFGQTDRGMPFAAARGSLGALLRALSPELRDHLLALAQEREVESGALLLDEGQSPDVIGYVLSGMLGMVKSFPDGRMHIIGLLVPADLYGRVFDGTSSYRIEALAPSRLLCFDRESFEVFLHDQPKAEKQFLSHMMDELDAAREWLSLIGAQKVIHRLASFLMILAQRMPRPEDPGMEIRVKVDLSRQNLAQYLGTSPESLSRSFHELEKRGAIHIITPYEFAIRDALLLRELSGQDLYGQRPGLR